MSENSHRSNPPPTQNQSNAASDDPREGERLTDNSKAAEKSAAGKKPPHDLQDQSAIEEFDREGMGIAPKE